MDAVTLEGWRPMDELPEGKIGDVMQVDVCLQIGDGPVQIDTFPHIMEDPQVSLEHLCDCWFGEANVDGSLQAGWYLHGWRHSQEPLDPRDRDELKAALQRATGCSEEVV